MAAMTLVQICGITYCPQALPWFTSKHRARSRIRAVQGTTECDLQNKYNNANVNMFSIKFTYNL